MAVLHGRRRCGKSRLILEAVHGHRAVYYVADDRESALQRFTLASEIGRLVAGFDEVTYPSWDALFARWWRDAGQGAVLVLDEVPALAAAAPEVPSILQKCVDRQQEGGPHLVLAGSSRRMMQGLVLDRSAPLFGRAAEILTIRPIAAGWIRRALALGGAPASIEAYAVWGGVPRYWELASEYESTREAVRGLVLSPLGVLHDEPAALLIEDMREVAQAASVLALVGRGCSRLTQIARRLEKPATSLSRPIQRLVELGLVRRDVPWGSPPRGPGGTLYRLADPFVAFWFRFVEPNRSYLDPGGLQAVARRVDSALPQHVAGVWEHLVRLSVPRGGAMGLSWNPASRWWGTGLDGQPMELDLVAESEDGSTLLIGECKWSFESGQRIAETLARKAKNFPETRGRRTVTGVWVKSAPPGTRHAGALSQADDVLALLT